MTSRTGPDGWNEALLGVSFPAIESTDSRP